MRGFSPLFYSVYMEVENRIKQYLIPLLEESGAFLVEMKIHQGKKILLFIDREEGISIDLCAKVSRSLMNEIDLEEVFTIYGLEVSSPGIDKPLKHLRQYRKNKGRDISILLEDGEKKKGRIVDVSEEVLQIEERGEKKELVVTDILMNTISKATLEIKF